MGSQVCPNIEIAILGPVEVRGARREFVRPSSAELVAYLACHRSGSSADTWAAALWPDRVVAPSTIHSTVSDARSAMGGGLVRGFGRLRLHPEVATDRESFGALAQSSDPAHWGEALSLIRGRPLEGIRNPDWAVLEGHLADLESEIVSLAIKAAKDALDHTDGHTASRAARKGLKASPYDERLYRILLLAADAEGHPEGVESVMDELLRALLAPGERAEPDLLVHPKTAALYRELSKRHHRTFSALRSAVGAGRR